MATLYQVWEYHHKLDFSAGVSLLEAHDPKALSKSVMSQLQMFASTGKEATEYLKGKLEYALANITLNEQYDSPQMTPNTDADFHTGEVADPLSEAEIERRPIPEHIKLLHKEHAHHHALMVAADNDQDRGYHATKIMTDIIPALDQYYDSVRTGSAPDAPAEPTKQASSDNDVRKLYSLRARISKLKQLIKKAKNPADKARYEKELEQKQAAAKQLEGNAG